MSALGSLPAIVREAARRFGHRAALVSPDGWRVSYRELHRLSAEGAAGVLRRGVTPGRVVALLMPSSPDYVLAYLSVARAAAITAGINPRLTPAERTLALDVIQPDLIVATADLADGVKTDAPIVEITPATRSGELVAGLRVEDALPPEVEPVPDRPVVIVLTSGTTGTPRGALFTEKQLDAIARIDAGEDWGGGGPMLATTEFAHIGFMTKLPWHLRKGARIHMLERWRAGDALRVISEEGISRIGGITAQIQLMLRSPDFDQHDLEHVEQIVVGGSATSPSLVKEARKRFGASFSARYSSTESGGVGTVATDDEAIETAGRPREGVQLQIRDDDGRKVPAGEAGQVWLRSPAIMSGYWRDDAETESTLVDGWLRTGDLGVVDDDGLLRLTGREKEMFIRGGYNVYPAEVESVLAAHPLVAEVAVVPRPDSVMGEIGVAVVVPAKASKPPELEDLRAFAADRLAKHKLPEALRIVEELPLTSMHKVDRRALAADAEVSAGAR